jgi:hypothetical protein
MHVPANAVSHQLSHNAIAVGLCMRLHGGGNIANAISRTRKTEPFIEALPRDANQPFDLRFYVADEVGPCRVSMPAVQIRADIYADDIAIEEFTLAGMPCTTCSLTEAQMLLGYPR